MNPRRRSHSSRGADVLARAHRALDRLGALLVEPRFPERANPRDEVDGANRRSSGVSVPPPRSTRFTFGSARARSAAKGPIRPRSIAPDPDRQARGALPLRTRPAFGLDFGRPLAARGRPATRRRTGETRRSCFMAGAPRGRASSSTDDDLRRSGLRGSRAGVGMPRPNRLHGLPRPDRRRLRQRRTLESLRSFPPIDRTRARLASPSRRPRSGPGRGCGRPSRGGASGIRRQNEHGAGPRVSPGPRSRPGPGPRSRPGPRPRSPASEALPRASGA